MGSTVKDGIVLVALLGSLGTLVAAHFAIGVRMLLRVRPWYRGLIALFVVPVAPLWAYEQRWRRLAVAWVAGLLIYALARAVAAI